MKWRRGKQGDGYVYVLMSLCLIINVLVVKNKTIISIDG